MIGCTVTPDTLPFLQSSAPGGVTINPLYQIQSGAQVRYVYLIWTELQPDAVYYAASQVAQQEPASCAGAAPLQLVGNEIRV